MLSSISDVFVYDFSTLATISPQECVACTTVCTVQSDGSINYGTNYPLDMRLCHKCYRSIINK